jgi:hypothetical protein
MEFLGCEMPQCKPRQFALLHTVDRNSRVRSLRQHEQQKPRSIEAGKRERDKHQDRSAAAKAPSFGGYELIKDDTKNGSFRELDYGDTDWIYKVMSTCDQLNSKQDRHSKFQETKTLESP